MGEQTETNEALEAKLQAATDALRQRMELSNSLMEDIIKAQLEIAWLTRIIDRRGKNAETVE